MEKVPGLLPKELTDSVPTWLSKRAIQCAGKQASGIVRGTRQKQKQRLYKYGDLNKKGMFKKARKLKEFIDKVNITKPDLKNLEPELDYRFIKTDFGNSTSFDCWMTLSSIGNKLKVVIPIKKTKHFNLMQSKGVMTKGLRLGKNKATFMFEIPDPPERTEGEVKGLDVGALDVYSVSDGQQSQKDKHGWTLGDILKVLQRKQKGSKAFERTQAHRDNFINWSINQLNLTGTKVLKVEGIKNIRKGRKSSRYLSHWTYTTIFDKLDSYCLEHGVRVEKVNPTYTSQRCSQCGWTRKSNRKGKKFKCTSCGFECDADLNASQNIVLDLPSIRKKERLQQNNKKGFYWYVVGQECIVPDVCKG